jgi:hypothetical protein
MLPDQSPNDAPSRSRDPRRLPTLAPHRGGLLLWVALTGLVAAGCGGDKGDDTAAAGAADRDGDGFPEAEDCNDLDDTIYPGATDAWYDGVDQDCGGDDDFDADLDGHRSLDFGGLDCDDSNPDVSPDAAETWYDGVDQNCDEESDYDADRDGFESSEFASAGTDCDDSRADVKPDAVEIWYDGVDQNCDGADDYDADSDGFPSDLYAEAGTDCDDTDDAINPDAEETWYDGIDGNCDGANDYDADGDGESAEGEISTGSDCDDSDATVFSGASERLDGLDSNCDEVEDIFTSDQDVLGSVVYGANPGDGLGAVLSAADLDGDNFDDLAIVQTADTGLTTGGYGLVVFVDGAQLSEGPVVAESLDGAVVTGALTLLSTGTVAAVDLFPSYLTANDGYALIGTPDYEDSDDSLGAAWVFSTGASNFTRLDNSTYGRAEIIGETPDGEFGATVLSDPDFDLDGDGTPELVISAPGADGGAVYVFYSGNIPTGRASLVASDADVILTGASASGSLGDSLAVGDFDASGTPWLVVGDAGVSTGAGAVYVIDSGFSSLVSGPVADRATTRVLGVAGSALGGAVAAGNTLDESGDGRDELIVGAPRAITRAGQLQMYRGSAVEGGGTLSCTDSGGATDPCYVRYSGSAIDGLAGTTLVSGEDVSGNGVDDILVGGPGNPPNGAGSGASWLLVDTGTSVSRSLNSADATFNGASAGDGLGYGIALGDFNGDGKADVAYGAPGYDSLGEEGLTRIYTSHYSEDGAE